MKARNGPFPRVETFTTIIIARSSTSTRRISMGQFMFSNRMDVCGRYVVLTSQESVRKEVDIRAKRDNSIVEMYGLEIDGWFGVKARKYENITSIPPT